MKPLKNKKETTKQRRRKMRNRLISVLTAAVVFTTTYALVLPAITMDTETAAAEPGIEVAPVETAPVAAEPAAAEPIAAEPVAAEAPAEAAPAVEPAAEPAPAETPAAEAPAEIIADENVPMAAPEAAGDALTPEPVNSESVAADSSTADSSTAVDSEKAAEEEKKDDASEEKKDEEEEKDDEAKLAASPLTYDCAEYLVSVSFGEAAALPEGTTLGVREYAAGSAEYNAYHAILDQKLREDGVAEEDLEEAVAALRLYELSFFNKEGVQILPVSAVDVLVEYKTPTNPIGDESLYAVTFRTDDGQPTKAAFNTKNAIDGSACIEAAGGVIQKLRVQGYAANDFHTNNVIGQLLLKQNAEETEEPEFVTTLDDEEEESITTQYLTADGAAYNISLTYEQEAGIPEGAELAVNEILEATDIYDEYVSKTEEALGDAEKVTFARFFDITIMYEGAEIQPNGPVNVKIELADALTEEVKVVHFEHVDAAVTDAVETPVVLDSARVEAEALGNAVGFEADSFSVYGVVETETITTQFITAEGETYQVTITYGPDAEIPQGATLVVNELLPDAENYDSYKTETVAALNTSEQDMNYIKLLDISIMNGDEEVEIKAPVDVEITLLDKEAAEQGEDDSKSDKVEMRVVHFGESPEEIEAGNKGETVTFSADSFSVYAIVGTIVNADFLTADGKTLKVTVTFDKDEPLPADAVLEVKELEEQDNEKLWGDRYQRLSNVLDTNYGKSKTGESRFLSISILSDGQEYKPKYPVQVKITYDDVIYGKEDRLLTIHYPDNENNIDVEDGLNEAFIEEAEVIEPENNISGDFIVETVFETDGFSDYDLTTISEDDSPVFSSFEEPESQNEKAPVLKAAGTRSVGEVPEHLKEIEDNGDGTYTIDLSVKGDADTTVEEAGNVNVLIVYDHSSSMTSRVSGGTASRADQAEDVVYDFVHSLFGYQSATNPSNIQVGLVRFARRADSTTNWTSNENTITQYFDNGGTDGQTNQNYSQSNNDNNGTNWQSALSSAITLLNSADNDPTFVIFVTDGAPTASGNGNNAINPSGASLDQLRPFYEAAQTNARTIQTRNNTTLYGIYCYGTEADLLDDLMYYSNTGTARNARTQTDLPVEHYYNTANTSALSAAIDEIFSQIVEALGITAVSIHDGTTNQVATTSGSISELLEVDETTYKYWISIPYTNNRFTRIDLVSGEEVTYNLRNNGNGTVTVTWGNNSVTVTGTMVNGVFKYQWTEANALYNYAPPAAHMTNGAVDWDLSSVGTLLNDVTYTVSFECYPSQYTLDLIADLKNGKPYSELDPNEQKYLHKDEDDYTLSTNTQATLTYSDSRNGSGPNEVAFNDVDPQSTAATKAVAISKAWSNILDPENPNAQKPESLTMHVTRDGVDRYELVLNDADHWQDSAFISYGIITIHDGNIVVKTPGHDYSFSEPPVMEYYWELDVPTLRPMLINAVETMLVKVAADEAPSMTGDNATAVGSDGYTYYKLTIGGTAHYYRVDEDVASLTAVNNRRSYLNVTKKVDEANAPADAEFSFDMTVVNSKASEGSASDTDSDYWVWFSVFDTINNVTVSGDDLTISGTGLQGPNGSGYYWIPSGNTVQVGMKKGYNIRFLNLPTGSTYSIVESSTMPEESFTLESITGNRHYKDDEGVEKDEAAGTKSEYGISGTIEYANSDYKMTFDNKYSTIDVQLKKVDENGSTISGSIFDLNKYGTSWTVVQTDIKPGDTSTSTSNPVDLGGLGIGRYRLTETEAPDGYIILTNHVYFEVYKDEGILKARLTDDSGRPVSSPTDAAAIDGPGTGDTPTYIITVTNTPGVSLPNTGGTGTLPYTLGGIGLILASALMYGFRMRRRERRLH